MTGVTVTTRMSEPPFATTVSAGPHTLVADEPASNGGGDRGPTPTQILLASLGACTAITVRMYAARKGWALAAVSVAVDYAAREPEHTVIERVLRLEGDLDAAQRERLLAIANRCPVHRILSGNIEIQTSHAQG